MLLHEIVQLDEGIDLSLPDMFKSYGSWMNPSERQPIYVTTPQGHAQAAKELSEREGVELMPGESLYQWMFNHGWVRAVHNRMQAISLSGPRDNLKALLPMLATLRDATNYINVDVEDCTSGRCITEHSASFVMPAEWGKLRRSVS